MMGINKSWLRVAVAGAAVAVLALTGCSSGGGTAPTSGYTPGQLSKSYAGSTIDVLMPPWGSFKPAVLAQFTKATGITVNLQTLAWDSIHDKVVTTAASGQSPADVVEMDWTWVAQFGAAGWFASLSDYLTPAQIKNSIGASGFVQGGKQIGLPYSLDFRGMEVDMTRLNLAGITSPPKTWQDVITDSAAIKKAGIAPYPVGLPLKILEGSATPWYALLRGSGGQVLTSSGQPTFDKGNLGTKSLEFIRKLYADGLVDPGSIGLTDQQVGDNFAAGQNAMILSTGPAGNAQFTDSTKSKIANDKFVFTHIPGMSNNTGPTIGLEEALAIPKASKKKAAAAMFISWWMQTPQLITAYQDPDMGNLPTTQAALAQLSSEGKLASGDTILQMVGNIQPVVAGGTPTWYSKFSAAAASTIQSVALGNQTAAAGIADLAAQTKKFAGQ